MNVTGVAFQTFRNRALPEPYHGRFGGNVGCLAPLRTMVASASPRAAPDPRWPVSFIRDHRIEFAMVQPTNLLAQVKTRALRQVVVLEVAGRLSDVIEDLDRAIQLALADAPRGVVCDLTAVLQGSAPGAVEVLATAGRHVRDWPAIPVAVVCPDPQVREALRTHPLGGLLTVTASTIPAVSAVLATPIPIVERLRLAPHPTAPRGSRNFVAHTLLDWGLGGLIPSASLVASELVTNSTVHAGTEVELSIGWTQGALRLTVRDNSPGLTHLRTTHLGQHGRGLTIVLALSRALGVLPTADDGKVVWAVLNALARPEIEESLVFPLLEQVAQGHTDVCATGGTHDQPCC